jgi:hypothetical protein
MRSARTTLLTCSLLAVTLTVLLDAAPPDDAIALLVETVPLNPQRPEQESVGALAYRGGLWLRGDDDERFGGLSDLRLSADRGRFQSISDCGSWLEAGLQYDSRGFLIGLLSPRLHPLLAPGGRPLRSDEVDAEALARDGKHGFVVSFEGRHHLWRYPGRAGLFGAPTEIPAPPGVAQCDPNAGIEAMTRLGDGRLLLIAEGEPGHPPTTTGWIGRGTEWSRFTYPLVYDPGIPEEPFHPTSLTTLPGSRSVLVLERRYPPLASRIRRVEISAFERGTGLEGVEVARLNPPLTLDNFEGIDAVRGRNGETLLFLVSDDNHCAKTPGNRPRSKQRTLLLQFALSWN